MSRSWLVCSSLFVAFALVPARSARAQCLDWHAAGELNRSVWTLAVVQEAGGPVLYAGGDFDTIGGIAAKHVARWDGHTWSALGAGVEGTVRAIAAFDDGSGPALYVGGDFESAGGAPASFIARWKNGAWSPLGTGTDDRVYALAAFDDGSGPALFVGGYFIHAGGIVALGVARWNGSAWSAVNDQMLLATNTLVVSNFSGRRRLYAGGGFHTGSPRGGIAEWDGSTWHRLGDGFTEPAAQVDALATFDDGSGPALYAAGTFSTAGSTPVNGIAKWDGSTWTSLDGGMHGQPALVGTLAVFDDGAGRSLYAGGYFAQAGSHPTTRNLARWDGRGWSRVGVAGVHTFQVLSLAAFEGAGPDLVVGGDFDGEIDDIYDPHLAVWRGCRGPGTLVCFGDGTSSPCPCANFGDPRHGCENSSGTGGGLLASTGTTNPDTVVLHASGETASALTIVVQSDTALAVPRVYGDGLGCLGGHGRRLYSRNAVAGELDVPGRGDPSITTRSAALGDPIGSGAVRFYQAVYRDSSATFCPSGGVLNATNALRIAW